MLEVEVEESEVVGALGLQTMLPVISKLPPLPLAAAMEMEDMVTVIEVVPVTATGSRRIYLKTWARRRRRGRGRRLSGCWRIYMGHIMVLVLLLGWSRNREKWVCEEV